MMLAVVRGLAQLMLVMLALAGVLRNGPADAHDAGLCLGAGPADAHDAGSCWRLAQWMAKLMLTMLTFLWGWPS